MGLRINKVVASLVAAVVVAAAVIGVALLASSNRPVRLPQNATQAAFIEGTAAPCAPMATFGFSWPVTVRVFHRASVVAQTELNGHRRLEPPEDYRFRLRVRPGSYAVVTSWGVRTNVELRDGQVVSVNLDAFGCK